MTPVGPADLPLQRAYLWERERAKEIFLTPTLKLKRNVAEKHCGPHFEKWAKTRKTVVWHEG